MKYDYVESKRRIYGILADPNDIKKVKNIEKLENRLENSNGVKTWITVLSINLIDSKTLYSYPDELKRIKVFRAYTSEILQILYSNEELQPIEATVIGDRILAIYSTSLKRKVYEACQLGFYINTYQKMLNKILESKGYPQVQVKIGIASDEDIVLNATTKKCELTDKIILGSAIRNAQKKSRFKQTECMHIDSITYSNINEIMKQTNSEEPVETWFTKKMDEVGIYYECNIYKTGFNDWIDNGMKEL